MAREDNLHPAGYQQIATATLASAVGLTVPTNSPTGSAGARMCIIQAEAGDIRWTDDGTTPTATVGMLLAAGSDFIYTGNIASVKLIRVAAGAIANVSYYK